MPVLAHTAAEHRSDEKFTTFFVYTVSVSASSMAVDPLFRDTEAES